MITGNIKLSSIPKESEAGDTGICSYCLNSCKTVPVDDSFSDQFGKVECWSVGSDCCGSEVYKGEIFLEKFKGYTARKDHINKNGEIMIKKGQRYGAKLIKGYYVDSDNIHHGIYEYKKTLFA